MEASLIAVRTFHFAASLSLTGIFAFACFIAAPAFEQSRTAATSAAAFGRRLDSMAWASLLVALVSGALWLLLVAGRMSGKPLGAVFEEGIATVVLTRTRLGEDWLLRLALAGLLAVSLLAGNFWRRSKARDWIGFLLSALFLATLAWAGHGAASLGERGEVHLAADILHLLAAGLWPGALLPLALLLGEARRQGDERWAAIARAATGRFSALAIVSVAALLGSGILNTWFLSGTVPALVGTQYGRLLLLKIALFLAMLAVASVNRLRLTPRLAGAAASRSARDLRRNAFLEAGLGLAVLGVVGLLGILPPGLHTEPRWPFPFRFNFAALGLGREILLWAVAGLFCASAVAAAVAAAAGRYRLAALRAVLLPLCIAAGAVPLSAVVERAYPTSFYAPAEPYSAASIERGARLYPEHCALCHGASGRGDGPAAKSLPIRPANLTEEHLFMHNPGDLFWWVSHGKGGVMPGFASVMKPHERWNVINFILARAAGDQMPEVGPKVTSAAAFPVPDFAFEKGGRQETLSRVLKKGPALIVLFRGPAPLACLNELAAAKKRFRAAGLDVIAVKLGAPQKPSPFVVDVSPAVTRTLSRFRSPKDGAVTELLLDRNGTVRARWTAGTPGGLASPETLIAEGRLAARFAVAAPSHAGHGG